MANIATITFIAAIVTLTSTGEAIAKSRNGGLLGGIVKSAVRASGSGPSSDENTLSVLELRECLRLENESDLLSSSVTERKHQAANLEQELSKLRISVQGMSNYLANQSTTSLSETGVREYNKVVNKQHNAIDRFNSKSQQYKNLITAINDQVDSQNWHAHQYKLKCYDKPYTAENMQIARTGLVLQSTQNRNGQYSSTIIEQITAESLGSPNNKGDNKQSTMEAQYILNELGFDPGPVDGIAGTKTQNAVIAFQNSQNIAPTGVISAILIQELKKQHKTHLFSEYSE